MVQSVHGRQNLRYLKEFRKLLEDRIALRENRTFGFEYELIGVRPLSPADFTAVKSVLPDAGFREADGKLIDHLGMYITFEPGGQIEFSSPPLTAGDVSLFDKLLERIKDTLELIESRTGVSYTAEPFVPGRDTAPLLLEAERYRNLHELLGRTSKRGHEMMKGTAAVHLHSSLSSIDELLNLWEFMCSLSKEEGFAMGSDRRDIWDHTDPSRCGLTCSAAEHITDSEQLLEKLVAFALHAIDLHQGIPFEQIKPEPDFREFLEHFTTIFTDVRLNLKGMTLELRTLDSRPLHLFRGTWLTFLDMLQRVMADSI